jgi:hypothetical protein
VCVCVYSQLIYPGLIIASEPDLDFFQVHSGKLRVTFQEISDFVTENGQSNNMYSSLDVTEMVTSIKMRWAGQVADMKAIKQEECLQNCNRNA